jgi:glyoxylase-like metal-dependent hydrolase (beta-lactamase superfamily II)
MNKSRYANLAFAACAALGVTLHLQGQGQDFSKVQIKTNKVSDNFYTLDGQGGTIGVLAGPDGVLMVDTQFAPLTDKIVAAVKQINPGPIRFVLNTHLHGDHTGGDENLQKMGITVMARDELRRGLEKPVPAANGTPGVPAPEKGLPMVTYQGTVTFHMNGETVMAMPIIAAHTSGDTMVKFVNNDVIMTGDFYRSLGYPFSDLANGGSLKGMIDGLGFVVGQAGPKTKIIPGHGANVDRNAVAAHRDMLIAVRDKIAPMVKQGKTVQEVIAAKPTADFDSKVENGAATSERFITWVYQELKAGN